MKLTPRVARATAVVALVAALAACTAGGSTPHSTVSAAAGDAPWSPGGDATEAAGGQTEDERLLKTYGPAPLDAFQWTPEQAATIAQAVNHVVTGCMEQLGFTYPPVPEEDPAPVTHWGDELGLIDPDIAATRGYASELAAGLLTAEPTQPPQVNDPAWLAALNDTGGCYEQGDAADPVDPAVNSQLLADLYDQALSTASADDKYRAAKDAWKSCVAAAGYALDEYPMPFSNDPPAKQPLEQAVTDVECKHSSGAIDAFVTALYAAEEALVQKHADESRRTPRPSRSGSEPPPTCWPAEAAVTVDEVEVEPAGGSVLARRRRRLWVAVVVAVVLAVSCGVATRWIKSPAQAAADTAPPARTVLTAPVTTQVVQSSIVGRGSVVASLPMSIPAPAAGKSAAVVSAVGVPPGGTVAAGDVLLAVSGRPVIALPGAVPAYRDLTPGAEGADVTQLQQALTSVGLGIGKDSAGVYGAGTQAAVADLYERAGFTVPTAGTGEDAADPVADAQAALTTADRAVQDAQADHVGPGRPHVGPGRGRPARPGAHRCRDPPPVTLTRPPVTPLPGPPTPLPGRPPTPLPRRPRTPLPRRPPHRPSRRPSSC